ncbi:MAG TPA: 16S rRNA (adenine(1518)-N(6)/adenine(1519)-N(6))-dimethyltransferase RsmA [Phycisphaerae bacterium]|nr:16S rRNA (adenine(1518)-N(6)/adenine(1519)-N(6))-dimethyltransferase RsmA [Phycisphaerae bacterium]HRR84165.1 16S rRNA (adenine(1518)-N(6)/adenine(1519)-N(6))-dimethyltransferase RsmA [Phycisphaerae bacterium]
MAQTKTEIRAMLEAAGLRPLRQHGQHFLIDGNLLHKLVEAAGITRRDVVLEVGPGTGTLTDYLVEQAGHVVAVEIDRGLHEICRNRFAAAGNMTLIHGDILANKSTIDPGVLDALTRHQAKLHGRIMLVANLPYQVATPLLMDLLMGELTVSPMCFTVQAEVADRLTASPGNKDYGPISVFAQATARTERITRVPPSAFWPEPQVDSAMLRINLRAGDRLSPLVREQLTTIVHHCFNHRRKMLGWTLSRVLSDEHFHLVESDGRWDLSQRPEQLSVEQWVQMAEMIAIRNDE